jgi:hypothetical protein
VKTALPPHPQRSHQRLGPFALFGITGHQQDRHVGRNLFRFRCQRDAIHDRHPDIGKQQIETV